MKHFKPLNLLYNALIIFVVAALFFGATPMVAGASIAAGAITGTALSFSKEIALFSSIQVEIWQNHIEQEIFKGNEFLKLSHDASENVINGKAVHIPQSGGSGTVVKNRATLPATVRKRNDTDVIYLLDEFTSDPVLIPNIDKHELSYDKRSSVLGEDMDKLRQSVAEEAIYLWLNSPAYTGYGATTLPDSNIMLSTGDAVEASAPGATGLRKATQRKDLQRMRSYFKTINRWFDGKMHSLITPEMEAQMFPADDPITASYAQVVSQKERENGIEYKCQGWNIMTRSSVARVNGAGTILTPEAVGTATDDEAGLFWYQNAVEHAMGDIVFYDDMGNPVYYGDVYSYLVRSGGRARRTDYKGVALLKQDKTA